MKFTDNNLENAIRLMQQQLKCDANIIASVETALRAAKQNAQTEGWEDWREFIQHCKTKLKNLHLKQKANKLTLQVLQNTQGYSKFLDNLPVIN